jgi:hypothetical protein
MQSPSPPPAAVLSALGPCHTGKKRIGIEKTAIKYGQEHRDITAPAKSHTLMGRKQHA